MAKRVQKRRPLRTVFILLLMAVLAAAGLYRGNTALQVSYFNPAFSDLPDGFDGCRIAVLSDLHGAEFGEDNAELIAAVAAQQPDLIAVVGDLIDEDTPAPLEYAAQLAPRLQAIAPVYYVTGNHEWATGGVPKLKETLSAAGWTVLSNQCEVLERNDSAIVLAGIEDRKSVV